MKKMERFIEVMELGGVKCYTLTDKDGEVDTGFPIEENLIKHAENLKWMYRSEIEITDKRTGKKLEIENGAFIWK